MLSCVEHEKSSVTLGPGLEVLKLFLMLNLAEHKI